MVLYILLSGVPPFWGDSEDAIFKMVRRDWGGRGVGWDVGGGVKEWGGVGWWGEEGVASAGPPGGAQDPPPRSSNPADPLLLTHTDKMNDQRPNV